MGSVDTVLVGTVLEVRDVDELVMSGTQPPPPYTEIPVEECPNPSATVPVEVVLGDVEAAFGHSGSSATFRLQLGRRGAYDYLEPGLRLGGGFFHPLDGHHWLRAKGSQPMFEVHEGHVWFQPVPDLSDPVAHFSMGPCELWVPQVDDLDGLSEQRLLRMATTVRSDVGELREGNRLWEVVTSRGNMYDQRGGYFRVCFPHRPPPPSIDDVECRGLDDSCLADPYAAGCPGHPGVIYCACDDDVDCEFIFGSGVSCENARCVRD